MLWIVCEWTGRHNWKTHHRGHERAYWQCGRWLCHESRKAPWYVAYQKFHGYGVVPGSGHDPRYAHTTDQSTG